MSILDTGEVCMEFIKEHHSQEFVKEVLRISCDGNTVRISSLFNVTLCAYYILFFFNSHLSSCVLGNALSVYVQT